MTLGWIGFALSIGWIAAFCAYVIGATLDVPIRVIWILCLAVGFAMTWWTLQLNTRDH